MTEPTETPEPCTIRLTDSQVVMTTDLRLIFWALKRGDGPSIAPFEECDSGGLPTGDLVLVPCNRIVQIVVPASRRAEFEELSA